jgi:serine/threonine protein kinase
MSAAGKDLEEIRECLTSHGYVLLQQIGCGRYGAVFTVRAVSFDAVYVVKVLDNQDSEGGVLDTEFTSEVETLMKLAHPHIVSAYAYFSSAKYHYVILEHCANGSLADLILHQAQITSSTVRNFSRQLVQALAYLHSQHFCHHDIKPANILLDAHGRVKLADFGFASRDDDYDSHKICGSLPYMAPELVRRQGHIDPAACDVWALGVTLYELATGAVPWSGETRSEMSREILGGGVTYQGDMPGLLVNMLKRMIEPDPIMRVAMSEVLEMPYLEQEDPSRRPGSDVGRIVMPTVKLRRSDSAKMRSTSTVRFPDLRTLAAIKKPAFLV